jgi:hypothetical protein
MKVLVVILLVFIIVSCEPVPSNEGITLSPITFAFKVSNDTPYLRVGDTLNIRAAVSSTVNGIILTDGEGIIAAGISRGQNIPKVSSNDFASALNNYDYKLIVNEGSVKFYQHEPKAISDFISSPIGDSIIMDYSFVFLKPGLYKIGGFQSSFYEGSKGKGRWECYFDVSDPHWWLTEIPNVSNPQPGESGYLRSYSVAITQ